MVFATPLRKHYRNETTPAHLDGTAKTIYAATQAATKLYRRPLRVMPAEVNHASEVIFQDYHFRNKVFSAAATPEEKKS